ncbi:MAG TPA: hypothetical protein VGO22_03495 [Pseudorhizobium sp.]|jgi:hypothetical protein|nr:hypothetical protein [Pseudorhizobium sp.]
MTEIGHFSGFPEDSKVPPRLSALLEGKGPKFVKVKLTEVGHPGDPRRAQLADFCDRHDLRVFFDPFADIWTISQTPAPTLFSPEEQ